MSNTNIDWDAVMTEYITLGLSHRALAEKYSISRSAVSRAAARGDWQRKRREHREAAVSAALEQAAADKAQRLGHLMDATNATVDAALAAVSDGRQFNRYIITRRIGYDNPRHVADSAGEALIKSEELIEEREFEKIDSKSLKEYISALALLSELVRDFYDIPTPSDASARRIASERLELERERVREDSPPDCGEGELTVRFINADWLEEESDERRDN